MDIFHSAQFKTIGLKEKNRQVNLFTELEEEKPYYLNTGLGYESNIGFYAKLKVGDKNLFGTNKNAWFESEFSQIGYLVKLGLLEPRLLGTRITSAFDIYKERKEEFSKNFGTDVLGSSLNFSRKITPNLTTGLGFRFEQREQFTTDSWRAEPGVDPSEFEKRIVLAMTPSVAYDTRDSFIRPRKGFFSALSVDFSKGLEKELDDFIRGMVDVRCYITPISRITFAWLGRAGHVEPYSSDKSIPADQLFFLGGTSDVRGYKENLLLFDDNGDPIGGRTSVAGSLEGRIDLGKNFELALFYDIGRLSDTEGVDDSGGFRSTVGTGLRYITPIGPIGILYGHKLDKKSGESDGRFHFSIGYTF